jgi:uroporphyrinogen-III decarboxylase
MQIKPEIAEYFDRNRQRWDAAYFGTDSVEETPVYAQLHEYAMSESPMTGEKFYTNPEELVRWEAKKAYDIGMDIPDITFDCYNIEIEALGGEVKFFEDKAPELVDTPVKEKSELLQLDPPDPYSDGRMPFVLEVVENYESTFGHFPRLNVSAPFTLAANLRGVQQLLMDMVRDKPFVKDLLDYVTNEVLKPYLEAIFSARDYEGEVIAADAIASPPNLDLELLEELALGPLLALKEEFGKDVTLLNWWGEGQVKQPKKLMELKLRASSGRVLEGQDPDVDEVGPQLYRNYAGEQETSLILGVGTEIMMLGDPTSIRERVKRYLEAGKKLDNGFLLYFTNFVGDTPAENIQAAMEVVDKFGIK